MAISIKKFKANILTCAGACALAALLAACGGGSHDDGHAPPPPPEPAQAGLRYDVIPLSLGGTGNGALVGRRGINGKGQVTGSTDAPDGRVHAFVYDGERMIDLGLMGGIQSEGNAINELGHATGWVTLTYEDSAYRGFLYDGAVHDLGTLGGRQTFGLDINDRTQITGDSTGTDGIRRAFLYQGGVMSPLPTPGVRSSGRVINENGTVAGHYDGPGGSVRSFIVDACRCPKDLGTLGGSQTFVFAINDAGQVAGTSETASGLRHAYRYENGTITDLGTLGGDFSEALSINASGWVTGSASTSTSQSHAFVHDGNAIRDLGTLGGESSAGNVINASGQVVGSSLTASGTSHAMSWTEAGGMVDLNKLLHTPPHGLVLTSAITVSNNGSIVAQSNSGLVLMKPRK